VSRDELIRELRAILAEEPAVRLALLFGSRARDQAGPGSDVDIAVDAPGADLFALGARISERIGEEVDLIPLDTASIPMLERLIAEGATAYESQRGRAAAWRARVLGQLETDRPWYRRMSRAWLKRVAREGLGVGR